MTEGYDFKSFTVDGRKGIKQYPKSHYPDVPIQQPVSSESGNNAVSDRPPEDRMRQGIERADPETWHNRQNCV